MTDVILFVLGGLIIISVLLHALRDISQYTIKLFKMTLSQYRSSTFSYRSYSRVKRELLYNRIVGVWGILLGITTVLIVLFFIIRRFPLF